jgi:hypothetical protein
VVVSVRALRWASCAARCGPRVSASTHSPAVSIIRARGPQASQSAPMRRRRMTCPTPGLKWRTSKKRSSVSATRWYPEKSQSGGKAARRRFQSWKVSQWPVRRMTSSSYSLLGMIAKVTVMPRAVVRSTMRRKPSTARWQSGSAWTVVRHPRRAVEEGVDRRRNAARVCLQAVRQMPTASTSFSVI